MFGFNTLIRNLKIWQGYSTSKINLRRNFKILVLNIMFKLSLKELGEMYFAHFLTLRRSR